MLNNMWHIATFTHGVRTIYAPRMQHIEWGKVVGASCIQSSLKSEREKEADVVYRCPCWERILPLWANSSPTGKTYGHRAEDDRCPGRSSQQTQAAERVMFTPLRRSELSYITSWPTQ